MDILPTISAHRGIARDKSVPPQAPEGIKSHIPNIYLNKYSSRRNDLMTVILNDDSNIEYNNIFPKILSKNTKIAVNVSLDKMPERKGALFGQKELSPTGQPQRMGGEMYYDLNYKHIDKKVLVASLGDKGIKKKIMQRNSNMMLTNNLKDRESAMSNL